MWKNHFNSLKMDFSFSLLQIENMTFCMQEQKMKREIILQKPDKIWNNFNFFNILYIYIYIYKGN